MQRGHRDAPLGDRGEVGARPGARSPASRRRCGTGGGRTPRRRARAGRGRCACRAGRRRRRLDLARREVDVEQRALRQRHVVDLLHQPRGERGGGLEVEDAAEAEVHLAGVGLLGDGDAGDAEDHALERGRHRAGVGDVVAEVGPVVDAGDDQVGREAVDQPERGEADAVDRRAVGREADRPVAERHLLDPERPPRGDRARGGRPVGVRRDDRQLDVLDLRRARAAAPAALPPRSRRRW